MADFTINHSTQKSNAVLKIIHEGWIPKLPLQSFLSFVRVCDGAPFEEKLFFRGQSTLHSDHISQLEQSLAHQLMGRDEKGRPHVTPYGERLYPYAVQILASGWEGEQAVAIGRPD